MIDTKQIRDFADSLYDLTDVHDTYGVVTYQSSAVCGFDIASFLHLLATVAPQIIELALAMIPKTPVKSTKNHES